MAKLLLLGIALSTAMAAGAFAQAVNAPAAPEKPHKGLIRSGHITSTGETMPHPGVPQGAGTTPLDRGIEREDDRIESGICKGC
jgi:putative alpha-1,2-mannosidase